MDDGAASHRLWNWFSPGLFRKAGKLRVPRSSIRAIKKEHNKGRVVLKQSFISIISGIKDSVQHEELWNGAWDLYKSDQQSPALTLLWPLTFKGTVRWKMKCTQSPFRSNAVRQSAHTHIFLRDTQFPKIAEYYSNLPTITIFLNIKSSLPCYQKTQSINFVLKVL